VSLAFIAVNAARVEPFAFSNVEVAAFVTGAWSVWLCAVNNVWNWPIGVANGALFVWVFWDARLYADAALNAWYVVVGLYGWWFWLFGGRGRSQRPVSHLTLREAGIHLVGVAGLTVWGYQHLRSLGDVAPLLDALTSALSISAFFMQARRQLESWWVWICVDLVYIPLYAWKGLPLTATLYVVFLAMCVAGVKRWQRELDSQHRFRHGVVAGKFMPYHRGHRYLLRTALSQCDRVTVLVGSWPDQPIPADLRAAWVRQSLPESEVVVVDQAERGLADDDTDAWGAATIDILGHAPDAVFTSEAYGDAWAAAIGCLHVSVDPERRAVPISATRIRRDPLANLGWLEPHVARYYQPRLVCILGAESTGKTTLVRDLAGALDAPWIPEYGRIYTELLPDPQVYAWSEADFIRIAEAQNALEDTALATSHSDVIVCDTNAAVTGVFCEEYTGKRSARVEQLAAGRRYDLYLLTDPDTPFQQDATGLRVDGVRRRRMHTRYERIVAASGAPIVRVSGTREARLEQALTATTPIVTGRGIERASRSGLPQHARSTSRRPALQR
jgi:HTH-type transcriptional repressor of NAD biosynthesis genes